MIKGLRQQLAPYSDELRIGYLSRLAAENGFRDIDGLLEWCLDNFDLPAHWFVWRVNDWQKLVPEFAHYLVDWWESQNRQLRIHAPFIIPSRRFFCPDCLVDTPYHRLMWADYRTGFCRTHMRVLSSACTFCGQMLNWRDVPLLKCKCGANLAQCQSEPVPAAFVDVLNWLTTPESLQALVHISEQLGLHDGQSLSLEENRDIEGLAIQLARAVSDDESFQAALRRRGFQLFQRDGVRLFVGTLGSLVALRSYASGFDLLTTRIGNVLENVYTSTAVQLLTSMVPPVEFEGGGWQPHQLVVGLPGAPVWGVHRPAIKSAIATGAMWAQNLADGRVLLEPECLLLLRAALQGTRTSSSTE